MDLKHFKPVAEDEHSYTVMHPSGKKLFIDKAKLSQSAHKAILHLYQGTQDFAGDATANDVSAQGGGDPMAAFRVPAPPPATPAQISALGGGNPMASLDAAQSPPAEDNEPVSQGGFTRKSKYLISPRDQAAIDAVRAKEGPVSGDADFVSKGPSEAQEIAKEASALQGRSPDASGGDPLIEEKAGMQDLLGQQIAQQEAGLSATQAAGQEIANAQQGEAQALGALPSFNDIVAKYQAKDQQLAQSYAEAKVEPEHFLHSMGTGSKILTGIGMVLSGMGAARTGQPNYAMQVLNDAIARDVDAQKNDQSKKMNLWKMNREAMGNDISANLATENQIKAGVLAKLQAAQTRAALPQEKLRTQMAIDQLKQEMLQNNLRRGLLTQGAQSAQAGGSGGALSVADPAMLVPEMVKDPAQQKAVYEEIKNRQNIAKNGQRMLDLVQQAIKDTSGMGAATSLAGYEPASVKELKNLMAPNFSNLDGTVRQAAADIAYNEIIPSGIDTPDRSRGRIQAMQDWIHSQQSAPTSKGNYIDLDRFKNTYIPNGPSKAQAAASPTIERKAKDGRVIIYDAKTKQPIGVKK